MAGRCLCVKSISGHVLAKGAGQFFCDRLPPLFNPAFPRHGQLDGGEASPNWVSASSLPTNQIQPRTSQIIEILHVQPKVS